MNTSTCTCGCRPVSCGNGQSQDQNTCDCKCFSSKCLDPYCSAMDYVRQICTACLNGYLLNPYKKCINLNPLCKTHNEFTGAC